MCILDPLQEGQEDTFSPTEFWSDDEELMFWEESQSTCLKSLPSPQPDREAFVADSVQDDTFSQTKFLSQDEELMYFQLLGDLFVERGGGSGNLKSRKNS